MVIVMSLWWCCANCDADVGILHCLQRRSTVRVQGEKGRLFVAEVLCLFAPVSSSGDDGGDDTLRHADDSDTLAYVQEYTSVHKDGSCTHPIAAGLDYVVLSGYYSLVSVRAIIQPARVVASFGAVHGGLHELARQDVDAEAAKPGAKTFFVVPPPC
jgi:hypothetical protein